MASIHFVCPVCKQNLKVAGSLAGRKGRCPFCSAKVRIPVEDHGEAEVIDAGGKQSASDVAPAPAAVSGAGRGLHGAADMLPSLDAGQGIRADDGMPSMGPRGSAPAPGKPAAGGDLQSQLDAQLGSEAAPAHSHRSDAATLKYNKDNPAPVIEPEDGARTKLPGEDGAPPRPAVTADRGAVAPAAAAATEEDLPAASAQHATLKYSPEENPVRASAELHGLKTQNFEPGAKSPAAEPASVPPQPVPGLATPPVSLAIPPPGHEHTAPAAGKVDSAAMDRRAQFGSGPEAAARTAALNDMLQANSDNQVGDVLAGLPRERPESMSAVENLGSRTPPPGRAPAQAPVTAVQNATMQAPAVQGGAKAAAQAGGSLIGDRCDPSRAGLSAGPLIAWVAAVILIVGGLTTWLVIDGLAQRRATIRSSQAYLRVTDLAAAQGEYFAQPSAPGPEGGPAAGSNRGGEFAASFGALQDRGLLNAALWQEGVTLTPAPADAAAAVDAPLELAQANGYRYVLWFKRQAGGEAPAQDYRTAGRLTRGFAVAAIPTDAANWAFAVDDRGRLIQWRYTPPAPGAPATGNLHDPVQAGAYPADSDFDKLPIR